MKKKQFYKFLISKIPIAWIAGLRLHFISSEKCAIKVRLNWLNQNPFKSMFWAVQGMAAELSSGVLLLGKIQESNHVIAMLVIKQQATFSKKAKGTIIFSCNEGNLMDAKIKQAIATREGTTFDVAISGVDEMGDVVSVFTFTWSIKIK